MVIGLRILALIIDCTICFFSIPLFLFATTWLFNLFSNIGSGIIGLLLVPIFFASFVVWPFLYFGATTGLWGKTPGKFICRLHVVNIYDRRPGFWRGLGRETLKLLAISCSIGAFIALFQIIYQGTTWYDNLCGTQVYFKPYVRSTKTQRNFRKYMKEQERQSDKGWRVDN